ncbi:MAG: hypothetical protein A2W38_05400 [Deltaproteobacteria bacterium RBG_19FT_COMBO_58_16]|nr:MAG: hypothetical protein A2W38_05400 [Deltaproteobacteria bacterium RBG_19FT_COMBO_58_16]
MGVQGEEKSREGIGVYIHIPFCASKCPYCDFSSVAVAGLTGPVEIEKGYTDCVIRELESFASTGPAPQTRLLQSVYIGGGTPSLFSPQSIARIIGSVKAAFTPAPDCEVTIEANPDSIDEAKLDGYLKAGANRLSIGVQSLDDAELKTLGRVHTADKAVLAFKSARKAGFANIGADLIFGIPGQSEARFASSLSRLIALCPEHISVYGLTYEEGTPMTAVKEAGGFDGRLPTDEVEEAMYRLAQAMLAEGGYCHYEVSNWALPGFESRHNRRYWLGGEYLGLGSGAHSYMRAGTNGGPWGVRWWNDASIERYCALIMDTDGEGGSARAFTEKLGRREAMVESLMLGIRMPGRGVEGAQFRRAFGLFPAEAFPRCAALISQGLLRLRGDDLLLTDRGLLLSDSVFAELLRPDI